MPFTAEEFLTIFSTYNTAVWPAQIALAALAIVMLVLAIRGSPSAGVWIGAGLALLWIWMGAVYHVGFFARINPAARAFGIAFILQGVLFAWDAARTRSLTFRVRRDAPGIIGGVLIAYALLVYPLVGMLVGHTYPVAPTFGLPCPTTIFTFGLLVWAASTARRSLLIVPVLWSLLGVSAVVSFGMLEDAMLPIAAVVTVIVTVWSGRRRLTGSPPALSPRARAVSP
jgi:hypothetical protein